MFSLNALRNLLQETTNAAHPRGFLIKEETRFPAIWLHKLGFKEKWIDNLNLQCVSHTLYYMEVVKDDRYAVGLFLIDKFGEVITSNFYEDEIKNIDHLLLKSNEDLTTDILITVDCEFREESLTDDVGSFKYIRHCRVGPVAVRYTLDEETLTDTIELVSK